MFMAKASPTVEGSVGVRMRRRWRNATNQTSTMCRIATTWTKWKCVPPNNVTEEGCAAKWSATRPAQRGPTAPISPTMVQWTAMARVRPSRGTRLPSSVRWPSPTAE